MDRSKQKVRAAAQKKRRQRVILCIAAISTVIAAVLAFRVIPHLLDLTTFRREQATLAKLSPFDAHLLEINPDYAGRLKVDGTDIDFLVVRGSDNVEYLNTTFYGEENVLGAVFMDYRCTEEMPHVIIYGHSASDENDNALKFGKLYDFLDEDFLAMHPTITFMENNSLSEFEIFSARVTDIHDHAYHLDFSAPGSFEAFLERNGAPVDAEQIITLSTCIGMDNDIRFIVQGAFKRTIPVTAEQSEDGVWRIERP